jgi:hypothetical protein
MADLTFTIKTAAELQGAEAAARALEVNIGKAKALGKDYAGLEQQLGTVKSSIANYQGQTEAAGQVTQATTGKLKLFAGQGENVKKALTQISAEAPLLGAAMRAVISPIGAAIAIAGVLFRSVKKDLDELNAKLDEMGAEAAKPMSDFAAAFRAAENEATASNKDFLDGLDQISTRAAGIGEQANAAVTAIQRLTTAQLELNNAAQAKAIAQVNLAEARGQITGPEAITERQRIGDFYAEQARQAQTGAENAILAAKEKEITDLQGQLAKAQSEAGPGSGDPKRTARITTLKKEADAAEAALPSLEKDLAALKEQQFERERAIEGGETEGIDDATGGPELAARAERIKNLENQIRLNKMIAARNPEKAAAIEGQLKGEDKARELAESIAQELAKKQFDLGQQRRATQESQNTRTQSGAIERETSEIEATRAREEAQRRAAEKQGASPNLSAIPPVDETMAAFTGALFARLDNLQQQLNDAKSRLDDSNLS